ncbi:MAG: hypothetical protein RIT81_45340 [Deltaproteobacteria bacterium]
MTNDKKMMVLALFGASLAACAGAEPELAEKTAAAKFESEVAMCCDAVSCVEDVMPEYCRDLPVICGGDGCVVEHQGVGYALTKENARRAAFTIGVPGQQYFPDPFYPAPFQDPYCAFFEALDQPCYNPAPLPNPAPSGGSHGGEWDCTKCSLKLVACASWCAVKGPSGFPACSLQCEQRFEQCTMSECSS